MNRASEYKRTVNDLVQRFRSGQINYDDFSVKYTELNNERMARRNEPAQPPPQRRPHGRFIRTTTKFPWSMPWEYQARYAFYANQFPSGFGTSRLPNMDEQ